MAKQLPQSSKKLNYTILDSSGHSASYFPGNVRENQPKDQASRWSSASNDQNQFLTLKLESLVLLDLIGFGKFHKVHVCNLKEFKVFAGPSLDSLHLILHTGLNNDTVPESFPLDYSLSGLPVSLTFPVQYVKIVPLAAWGSNFNFSIWYVELKGWVEQDDTRDLIKASLEEYNRIKELETTRLVMKFLRQHNHTDALHSLQRSSGAELESPWVTQLHSLISAKKLQEAEALLLDLYTKDPSIFDQHLHENVPYEANWTRLDDPNLTSDSASVLDENGDYKMMNCAPFPSARGGHQMIWDSVTSRLFLLGGWDGKRDLSDFWSFDPTTSSWTLLSGDVEREGGPSARSCHKAALHVASQHIYVLGRYIDPERRDPLNLPCDFFRYSLEDGKWVLLSSDVQAEGGPGCIYDHQMVVDEEEECIWVFGGRLLSGTNEHSVYSGLYRYDLESGKWTHVQSDSSNNTDFVDQDQTELASIKVPSRIGHSMLFDPHNRSLMILAGQRYKDQLTDFYRYSVDRHSVTHMCKNLQMAGGPEAGYTQRACFDPVSREMFLFSTLVRTVSGSSTGDNNLGDILSFFWCFDLARERWVRIKTGGSSEESSASRPPARFAHQLAYDPATKTVFLFGGNPGNPNDPSARLDDFWMARLAKPLSPGDLLRKCQFLLRRAQFDSLVATDIPAALKYLQNDLAQVVDHLDPIESKKFRSLSTNLFKSQGQGQIDLFTEIVSFLPKSMQPPLKNL